MSQHRGTAVGPSPEEIKAAILGLEYLLNPDDVLEVRAMYPERPTKSGKGAWTPKVAGFMLAKNIPAMASKIADITEKPRKIEGLATAVYFTPQELDSTVLARCCHALVPVSKVGNTDHKEVRPKLTSDSDVSRRRLLLIDVDATRGVIWKGRDKPPATDAERAATHEVAENVRGFLVSRGWAAPIVGDSGNGVHMYFVLPTRRPVATVASTTRLPCC